ncbi:dUTPase [Saimiriine gammaherpesvirus 2]|uniref:Deoxyuridine 5'-triphosphate nucleotidohydrolase n=1 Tax=Saimiriine herpesvirus 2 (strain 11) TaxID=10383 RepID=DUT_SHV21|nr:dUTPase [Saimiriine gammaherpesvirus 2]Q01034.1 RecName: Full=Deoxyuridine 5'-triphosphate nucleotidohydrolase; Short=dUTPase; AltName: Full=dUTP pyrophosphatase [Herpesvirus saimiri (strain 11)]pir/WZBEP1/ dUTP diphosphatase (EC 3.6.1.23) - saimiriine herpesvirus 1 (strain 11) [Saimiriine alphaherpesvirus 1]AAA46131.1 dUTPase [Saimiriine gammaherpesvirus 2]CAA45677.1 dUTPase [Saimiriine gammaherpesvirus 2]
MPYKVPEIYYRFEPQTFYITSPARASNLQLINHNNILVKAGQVTIVSTGIIFPKETSFAFILYGKSAKSIFCHTGLIDPGFQGELKLIVLNKTEDDITLFENDLRVSVTAFVYGVPKLHDYSDLCPPRYSKDAGFDLYLPTDVTVKPRVPNRYSVNICCPAQLKSYKPVLFGRSGLAAKGLTIKVSRWQNQLQIIFYNYTKSQITYTARTRIAQVVFMHKKHLPTTLTRLKPTMHLSENIKYSWARVSFQDIKTFPVQDEKLYSSSKDTSDSQMSRGDAGLGSSGLM